MNTFTSYYKTVMQYSDIPIQEWHKNCAGVHIQIGRLRQDLMKNKSYNMWGADSFLPGLIRDRHNNIASRGQSYLSESALRAMIKHNEFRDAFRKFLLDSNEANYLNLKKIWEKLLRQLDQRMTPLLINRIAAAFTTIVSTTAYDKDFNNVLAFLNRKFPKLDLDARNAFQRNWFSKNLYLIQRIKTLLEVRPEERGNIIYDESSVSFFPWAVVEVENLHGQ